MLEPKATITRLLEQKYKGASVVFWAGSVTTIKYTGRSDFYLVVIFDQLPNAYREALFLSMLCQRS